MMNWGIMEPHIHICCSVKLLLEGYETRCGEIRQAVWVMQEAQLSLTSLYKRYLRGTPRAHGFHLHGPYRGVSPTRTQGNKYALTMICMLSGWTWCVPIQDKTTPVVVQAYLKNVHHLFGPSRKILSDNGTEFKNKLFDVVTHKLGIKHKIYSPPFRPQSNGQIEGFHTFLKACLVKHVSRELELDEVCPIAMAAYNFLPNEHSQEAPFFIMFGRDPCLPFM